MFYTIDEVGRTYRPTARSAPSRRREAVRAARRAACQWARSKLWGGLKGWVPQWKKNGSWLSSA
ncbi:MAG TPA: hypothetical protein VKG62_00690, partial [Solirubrobacteraceae bacterium]|nr:hypothetical protein [Solirubrobacteraceae bacterium]